MTSREIQRQKNLTVASIPRKINPNDVLVAQTVCLPTVCSQCETRMGDGDHYYFVARVRCNYDNEADIIYNDTTFVKRGVYYCRQCAPFEVGYAETSSGREIHEGSEVDSRYDC